MNNSKKIPRVRLSVERDLNPVLKDIVITNSFVSGPHIKLFEKEFADLMRYSNCALVSNGFSALFLTIKALDFKGKRILVPALSTCFSIVNAVLASGNFPVYCPLNKLTLNLDLAAAKEIYKHEGFDMIIAVSHFGIPADIASFRMFKVPIIEDAAQSLLTRTNIKSEADAVIFSFYPTKFLNAIDGGCVLSNDRELINTVNEISYYDHQFVPDGIERYNFRFLNIHAAIGLASLGKIDKIKSKIKELSTFYYQLLLKTNQNLLLSQFDSGVLPQKLLFLVPVSTEQKFLNLCEKYRITASKELVALHKGQLSSIEESLRDEVWSLPFFSDLKVTELKRIERLIKEYAGI